MNKLRCDKCGLVIDEPAALRVFALEFVYCSCGGRLVRVSRAAELALWGGLLWLAGAALNAPLAAKIGEEITTLALFQLGREVDSERDFARDTKLLAVGHAKLDRDDPTLN